MVVPSFEAVRLVDFNVTITHFYFAVVDYLDYLRDLTHMGTRTDISIVTHAGYVLITTCHSCSLTSSALTV